MKEKLYLNNCPKSGKATIPLICNYGFEKLKLHRIKGFVESENKNFKKALSKLDFEFEGTMRECELKNDNFICVDIYSKIKSYSQVLTSIISKKQQLN